MKSRAGIMATGCPVSRSTAAARWAIRALGPSTRSGIGRAIPSASAAIRVSRPIAGSCPCACGTSMVEPFHNSVRKPFPTVFTRSPGHRSPTATRPRSVVTRAARVKAAKGSSKAGIAGTRRGVSMMSPDGDRQATSTLRMRGIMRRGRLSGRAGRSRRTGGTNCATLLRLAASGTTFMRTPSGFRIICRPPPTTASRVEITGGMWQIGRVAVKIRGCAGGIRGQSCAGCRIVRGPGTVLPQSDSNWVRHCEKASAEAATPTEPHRSIRTTCTSTPLSRS